MVKTEPAFMERCVIMRHGGRAAEGVVIDAGFIVKGMSAPAHAPPLYTLGLF